MHSIDFNQAHGKKNPHMMLNLNVTIAHISAGALAKKKEHL